MAADGSAANRLAQAGKLIAGGLIAAVLAAVRAVHVLRGAAQAQHAQASAPRIRHVTRRPPSASMWRWSAATPA